MIDDRIVYVLTMTILQRWEAAGFTSARLEGGLPRPERGHRAVWQVRGRLQRCCSVCGRNVLVRNAGAMCPGQGAYSLVADAVARGVPFGLGEDGLPTAGVPVAMGDVLARVARATCRPIVQRAA